MHYPTQLIRITEKLSLYLPIPGEIRPLYEKTLSADPDTPFPFWAKVWPAAVALSSFLKANKNLITGKNVLEIGAGTGIPSFSITKDAASVIISDHAAEAVALMEKNIGFLGLNNVKAMCLDWNQFPKALKADTVLLSDINYAPEQFSPLLILIQRLLEDGSTVIIATPQRIMGIPFAEQLSPFIVTQEEMIADDTAISLFVLAKTG